MSGMVFSRTKIMVLAFITEGAVFLAALILARWTDAELRPVTYNLIRDLLIGTAAAVFPFLLFLFSLSEKASNVPLIGSVRKLILTEIRGFFANSGFVDLVAISFMAGCAEEFLFRGILQARFGIIVASVLFGLIHFVTPAYVLLATVMGLYIGVFFEIYDSLLVPVQIHFAYDLGALVYLKYFVRVTAKSG